MKTENIRIGTEFPLDGILTLPDDTSVPVPACVFVHGSGSSDKDEHIGKLYPFRDLAEGLGRQGIASYRYDKRSYVHGLKMIRSKKPITVREETIEDAITAADMLRKDSRIDPERIYIIGHSMGAMLAPRIDAEGGNFRGLIMMAGSPCSLDEIMIRQLNELSDQQGKIAGYILGKQKEKIFSQFEKMDSVSDEEAMKIKMGGGTTLYYWVDMKKHPVSQYLEKLEKPVLIMQGSMDAQVRKDIDYAAYQEMLKGRENVTFRLYPGLSHLFVPASTDNIAKAPAEYKIPKKIPDDVINDIAAWIREN